MIYAAFNKAYIFIESSTGFPILQKKTTLQHVTPTQHDCAFPAEMMDTPSVRYVLKIVHKCCRFYAGLISQLSFLFYFNK